MIEVTTSQLADERRQLQGMTRPLATELCYRSASELLIQHRHQTIAGVRITRSPGMQKRRHIVTGRLH
jgi:hypothetical protein